MHTIPALLVLASAVLHAYWNFLLKRAGGGQLVVGLSKAVEAMLLLPVVMLTVINEGARVALLLSLAVVGAVLVGANYVLIAVAYGRADLSFVYPISRGGILLLLPVAGYLAFGERLDPAGSVGLLFVVLGIAFQLARARPGNGVAAALALVAATAAAGYTLWDKHAVQSVAPPVYFATYSVLVGAAYGIFIAYRYGFQAARTCWNEHTWTVVKVAVANGGAYLLVLYALRTGISSYVIGLRQVSIVIGALLGWRLLGERPGGVAWLGIVLILAGCSLVALAPAP